MTRKYIIPNIDDFLQRYIEGESENALAKELNISRCAFRTQLLNAGIKPRTQSESEAIKWKRMTASQREKQVAAAHNAARGREVPFDELCMRAKKREGNLAYNVSHNELILGNWLKEIGIPVIHNFAVGPYNCDIGTGSIIVEVWGGHWHPKPIDTERTKYILDSGYSVLIIDVDKRNFPITRAVTEYVVSLNNIARTDPASIRQYWMIRGSGELIFRRFNSDNISLIPPFTSGRDVTTGQYKRIPR